MKRLVMIIAAAVILYAIYYDINYGTLPATSNFAPVTRKTDDVTTAKNKSPLPYYEKKVSPGDTVLSLVEEQLNDSIPVPLSNVVSDFKKLNNGLSPTEIQAGKIYKFPKYEKEISADPS
ncbi:hypothetical protein [Bacillus benzoevorans]|uniref:LysM domain-containing protein n=1 Tax=Bacillus benzoevorans TaxID=1456 RepID=A0A7X0HSI0_9BACI|nr:hypothetical protein [Bacillus benzoevorans]MBB6446013.1 hypothetical protein [Bacillus benzoevorans]